MKPLSPDVARVVDFNAENPNDRTAATRALNRLLRDATRVERAWLLAFVKGHKRGLGGYSPAWAYQIAGALLLRYPAQQWPDPKVRGARVREVLRSRLALAMGERIRSRLL